MIKVNHICFYKDNQEVININDVIKIEFIIHGTVCVVTTSLTEYAIHENMYDRFEVDYYDFTL